MWRRPVISIEFPDDFKKSKKQMGIGLLPICFLSDSR